MPAGIFLGPGAVQRGTLVALAEAELSHWQAPMYEVWGLDPEYQQCNDGTLVLPRNCEPKDIQQHV
jgi:hypothetical protein